MVCLAISLSISLTACAAPSTDDPSAVAAPFGEPLPGLTAEELARFEAGRAQFNRRYEAAEGLGPRFNENACNACHTDPADGGTGETSVTKATRSLDDDVCDPLTEAGGDNLRIRTTGVERDQGARVQPPPEATHVSRFTIPFIFGLGIVEAVPDETLRALADPDDADGDGISGRQGRHASGAAARYGRKADVHTLAAFVESAFRLEMGLTTPAFPDEALAGDVPPVGEEAVDPTPEPEVDQATLDAVTDFVRFLAPPARNIPSEPSAAESARLGEELFSGLGCARCHVPSLTAGRSPVGAISGATVGLYSDLLLHDMGPELEGTCAAGATTREYRTEPLMGLRARRTFMHDGRFRRVIDAVLAHDGEAKSARDGFAALDRLTQEAILRFLDTL
jgi:CxxC motif-containing protein (DUF1111 family)